MYHLGQYGLLRPMKVGGKFADFSCDLNSMIKQFIKDREFRRGWLFVPSPIGYYYLFVIFVVQPMLKACLYVKPAYIGLRELGQEISM